MLYAFKVSLFFINLKVSIFILIVHWLFTSNQLQGSECNYLIKSRPWLHSMFNFNVRSMSSQQLITLPWFNKLTIYKHFSLFFSDHKDDFKQTSIRVQGDFNRIQEHMYPKIEETVVVAHETIQSTPGSIQELDTLKPFSSFLSVRWFVMTT